MPGILSGQTARPTPVQVVGPSESVALADDPGAKQYGMRSWRLTNWAALLVLVLVAPMPASAFELSGGVSLGGFQVGGTLPRLAVTPIDCRKRGLSAFACAEVCNTAGAYCLPHAVHPKKSGQGAGELRWCKNGSPTYVYNYDFTNGDSCALTVTPIVNYWLCAYPGGK